MADNADDSAKQAEAEPRAGQRLANARRANGISMRDIAKELHLDEVKVQALEDNRFDVLGAPVFTKGYLRKYAELVHVSIDDVLADYYRMNRATGAPPVVGPRRPKAATPINPGPWIIGIVILALVAAAAYWWLNRSPAATVTQRNVSGVTQAIAREPAVAPSGESEAPAPQQVETVSSEEPTAATDTGGSSTPDPAIPDQQLTQPTASAQSQLPPATSPSLQTAGTQLSLLFSGDCWTEVTDGSGNRLFFGLGTAGRNVTVSGMPPIRVLLGDNDNVRLQVNGVNYVVAPADLRGNTARLSIGGS